MLASVDQISGAKRKQNLTEFADAARLSKQLATIVYDVPVELDLEAEVTRRPDRAGLREIFREWELRDPLRRLEEALEDADIEAIPRPEQQDARTVPVRRGRATDVDMLGGEPLALVALAPEIAEGELIPREERWRFGAYAGGSHALAGEVDDPAELVAAAKQRARSSPTTPRRSATCRRTSSSTPRSPPTCSIPPAAATRSTSSPRSAGWRSTPRTTRPRSPCSSTRSPSARPQQINERGLVHLLEQIELPLVHVLRECEKQGIKLDTVKLEQSATRIRADAAQLEREIWELAGEEFVIGSPQQLGHILFEKLGLSRKRRGKTGFSTDARVLQAIRGEHEIIPKIERFRELSKLAQTYLDALPAWIGDDGRLHTTFNQVTAATGRLSSINPNLQNIPVRTETGREIRACFVAEPGNVLISVDYSQVELRVLAHIADEQVLGTSSCAARTCTPRPPPPSSTPRPDQLTVGMRSKAKMVNYGIVYGLSAYGLADRLQIEQEEAQEFIDRYLERFPAVAQFMADAVTQAEEHGYVSTLFGRRRQIPEIRARNWQTRKLGERLAVNSVIQGTAADIIKVAMVRSHDALRRRRPEDPLHPADPRRAAVRGARGGGRARDRDRVRGDGRRGRDRPAAGGRRPASARTGWTPSSGPRARSRPDRRRSAAWSPCRRRSTPALGKAIGTFQAAFFSFATGTVDPRGDRRARARRLRPDRRGPHARAAVPDRRRARRLLRARRSS